MYLGYAAARLYSQYVEEDGDTGGTAARRALVAKLEELIEFLGQATLDELRRAMNATVQTDTTRAQLASPQLLKRLKDIRELADILDNIDPHSIAERESKELFKKHPAELVEDALVKGKLREDG